MAPEDIYLWFLPSKWRMIFAVAVFVGAVVLVTTLLVWMFAGNRRGD